VDETPEQPPGKGPASSNLMNARMVVGILLAVVVLLFIVLNHQQTHVSFVVFSARVPLWLALALVGAAGFGAGWLFGRRRYKMPKA
jgi:uncharacterized integral membrane protein